MIAPVSNPNARLGAFCDGVFAIALTLLIVDIKVPAPNTITSTAELWGALRSLAPSAFAFVLSFTIILITWVNHHGALMLVHKTSGAFIYANGFLLLTVVVLPFPTALLGAFIGTEHAAPAVVLYDAILVMQAVGWLLFGTVALRGDLLNDERAVSTVREHRRNAQGAIVLYSLLTIAALKFPVTVAIVTTVTWIFWLILSIRLKHT